MSARGFSPLERRALLALVSLIRDREPDEDFWTATDIPLRALYERCYHLDPAKSWELQCRNQRQAIRRALGRLHPEYVYALALAWCEVFHSDVIRWQGGGSRAFRDLDRPTPRWRLVGLTDAGIKAALLLEQEPAA
jgi:hypothetical protein